VWNAQPFEKEKKLHWLSRGSLGRHKAQLSTPDVLNKWLRAVEQKNIAPFRLPVHCFRSKDRANILFGLQKEASLEVWGSLVLLLCFSLSLQLIMIISSGLKQF